MKQDRGGGLHNSGTEGIGQTSQALARQFSAVATVTVRTGPFPNATDAQVLAKVCPIAGPSP